MRLDSSAGPTRLSVDGGMTVLLVEFSLSEE